MVFFTTADNKHIGITHSLSCCSKLHPYQITLVMLHYPHTQHYTYTYRVVTVQHVVVYNVEASISIHLQTNVGALLCNGLGPNEWWHIVKDSPASYTSDLDSLTNALEVDAAPQNEQRMSCA